MRNHRQLRALLLTLLVLCAASVLPADPDGRRLNRVRVWIESLLQGSADQVSDLCGRLREEQARYIDIVPPGMPLLVQDGGIVYFRRGRLPRALRAGLVPRVWQGVTVYPVAVCEDPDTRDCIFINAKGDEIYSVPAPRDYDPRWLALEKFPELYDGTRSDQEIEQVLRNYDPARVGVEYKLVNKRQMFDYIARKSSQTEERAATPNGDISILEASPAQPTVDELRCSEIAKEGESARLTIAYPAGFSNRIDLFSCTNLMEYLWRLRLDATDTAQGSTELDWVDPESISHARFYAVAAAMCDTQSDPDGDGLTSTRERLLHRTDPLSPDSDGDGMPDGWEASHTLNPLVDDASADPDGDGWNNMQEYKRGGNPSVSFLPDTNNTLRLNLMTPVRNAN